jgi:hypothetical protein
MKDPGHHPATLSARKIIPHWPSSNIPATIKYYTDTLHFLCGSPQHTREDPSEPTFVSVLMGPGAAANIYFFKDPEEKLERGKAMIAMSKAGLEEYYAVLKSERRVKWVEDVCDKEWGYRQFEVEDEDANRLQFFCFIEGG